MEQDLQNADMSVDLGLPVWFDMRKLLGVVLDGLHGLNHTCGYVPVEIGDWGFEKATQFVSCFWVWIHGIDDSPVFFQGRCISFLTGMVVGDLPGVGGWHFCRGFDGLDMTVLFLRVEVSSVS